MGRLNYFLGQHWDFKFSIRTSQILLTLLGGFFLKREDVGVMGAYQKVTIL